MPNTQHEINWTHDKLNILKQAHRDAVQREHKRISVQIDGEPLDYDVNYAGYLIEFLGGLFALGGAQISVGGVEVE